MAVLRETQRALVAFVGSFAGVQTYVHFQVGGSYEFFLAYFALVTPVVLVFLHVDRVGAPGGEDLFAFFAFQGEIGASELMLFQAGESRESLGAELALERFLGLVAVGMHRQVGTVGEALVAQVALVGLFARM